LADLEASEDSETGFLTWGSWSTGAFLQSPIQRSEAFQTYLFEDLSMRGHFLSALYSDKKNGLMGVQQFNVSAGLAEVYSSPRINSVGSSSYTPALSFNVAGDALMAGGTDSAVEIDSTLFGVPEGLVSLFVVEFDLEDSQVAADTFFEIVRAPAMSALRLFDFSVSPSGSLVSAIGYEGSIVFGDIILEGPGSAVLIQNLCVECRGASYCDLKTSPICECTPGYEQNGGGCVPEPCPGECGEGLCVLEEAKCQCQNGFMSPDCHKGLLRTPLSDFMNLNTWFIGRCPRNRSSYGLQENYREYSSDHLRRGHCFRRPRNTGRRLDLRHREFLWYLSCWRSVQRRLSVSERLNHGGRDGQFHSPS
jgi:hypothetical protein